MPEEGVEPSRISPHDFKSCAYTIPPLRQKHHEYLYDRARTYFIKNF